MIEKKESMDSDEKALFDAAMKGVKPLRASPKVTPRAQPHPAAPKKTKITKKEPHKAIPKVSHLSAPWDTKAIGPECCLSFGQNRVQPKQFKALKQGQIRPEARLDLHGIYLDKADITLVEFIREACQRNLRCILIIHGKGGRYHEPPILKNHVNHWLKQLPDVLAFHSAKPRDGGFGAVYVLLKGQQV